MSKKLRPEEGPAWELIARIDEAQHEAVRRAPYAEIVVHGILGLKVRFRHVVPGVERVLELERTVTWRDMVDARANPLLRAVQDGRVAIMRPALGGTAMRRPPKHATNLG